MTEPPSQHPHVPGRGKSSATWWWWGLLLLVASLLPVGVIFQQYGREREAVRQIEAMGGWVQYSSPFPAWVSDCCGEGVVAPFSEKTVGFLCAGGNLDAIDFNRLSGAIRDLRSVRAMYLGGRDIGDGWLSELESVGNVQRLVIEDTSISDEGISHLVKWRQLESLVLGPSDRLSDRCLRHLEDISSLRDLTVDVHANSITDEGISDLKKVKPHLR